MDMSNFQPIDIQTHAKHSKTLYRSICMPSMVQSYSLCIEYMKRWFTGKFDRNYFKSTYLDGKNVFNDFRTLSRTDLLKRKKPALSITPAISWDFNNENIDSYPYGLTLYTQMGRFRNSFFNDEINSVYMGLGLETLLMSFNFRIKVETRAQQMDLYKYMKIAHRVGFSCGEDVDLDFHIPYDLIIQIARDTGFEIIEGDENNYPRVKNITKFMSYLNMHSTLPFLYKHRTINGNHEFFLRMSKMYVHVKPMDLNVDDGEREGQMLNNFTVELNTEVRFPAPRFYAYYSDNAHELKNLYTAWRQPEGEVNTIYTFKALPIPDRNINNWPLYMTTSYEDEENVGKTLSIDFSELLEGDIGDTINDTLALGLSPAIFVDLLIVNGGHYVTGNMDWEKLCYVSDFEMKTANSFIGLYIDNEYLNNHLINKKNMNDDTITKSDPAYHDKELGKSD